MQDTKLEALAPNAYPDYQKPSLSLFEESVRIRLELFSLDAHIPLENYLNQDFETVEEQLDLQIDQLRFLLNEVRLLRQWKVF